MCAAVEEEEAAAEGAEERSKAAAVVRTVAIVWRRWREHMMIKKWCDERVSLLPVLCVLCVGMC